MSSSKYWNILIVDDNLVTMESIKNIIKDTVFFNKPINVICIDNSKMAQEILSSQTIHIVIVDISLEHASGGLTLVRFVRNNLNNHFIRIILTTDDISRFDPIFITTEFDINGFIIKPRIIQELLIVYIITSLRSYDKLRSLQKQLQAKDNDIHRISSQSDKIIQSKTILDAVISKGTKVPLVIISKKLRVTHYNKAARIFFGIPTNLVIGKTVHNIHYSLGLPNSRIDSILEKLYRGDKFQIELTRNVFGKDIICNISIFTVNEGNSNDIAYVLSGDQVIPKVPTNDSDSISIKRKKLTRPELPIPEIIGLDPKMLKISALIRKVSHSSFSVLITGESGTGKEVIATAIHKYSSRHSNPYLAINCAAIPNDLLESELFGYTKGAFTGADRDQKGLFEICDGGTLFLDEIGDATPAVQAKLLRVIQDGTFQRIGSGETITVDVRIISATNKALQVAILNKSFREDLFYRLCVIPIEIPPIRFRKGDISLLLNYFLNICKIGTKKFNHICKQSLCEYNWPGNVREIRNMVQFIAAVCDSDIIQIKDLPDHLRISLEENSHLITSDLPKEVSELSDEKTLIVSALTRCNGKKVAAAKLLNIDRSTLYRKIKKYQIESEFLG